MSKIKSLCLGIGLFLIIFSVWTPFVINNNKNKERVDRLKNINISHSSYLISPIISELNRVIGKREPGLRFTDIGSRVSLSNDFQKLQEEGKATGEEVGAIKEFEEALDNLSRAIRRLGSIPSLRREMRL